jgi:hypothetical protein
LSDCAAKAIRAGRKRRITGRRVLIWRRPMNKETLALIEAAEYLNSHRHGRVAWERLQAAISSAKAAEEGGEATGTNKAPQHAFEVSIRIGANEAGYVAIAMQEISETIDPSGIAGGCSGGWDGSWSIDVRKRDVLPDDYRNELEQWWESIPVREKEGL